MIQAYAGLMDLTSEQAREIEELAEKPLNGLSLQVFFVVNPHIVFLQAMPFSDYFDEKLCGHLHDAMVAVVEKRPADPVAFVAYYLLERAHPRPDPPVQEEAADTAED